MRPHARSVAIVLPLATTLAVVLPATARPNKPAAAAKRYRFSFHVTAKPSSGNYKRGGITITAAGSGSFALGRLQEQGQSARTWKVTRPQGSVTISWPEPVDRSGVMVLLQADIVGGTYTTKKVAGGLEQTARLTLYPWHSGFGCNLTASTRFTLLLTDLPQRKGNQDTVGVDACSGSRVGWAGSPTKLVVRIAPA